MREGIGSSLGWLGIVRLGVVQVALGAIVVLTTATLNRVMVIELGLAAVIPGMLVGIHYAVQLLRPLWGHASDRGGRRTPWIVGGIALLGLGAVGASLSVAMMADAPMLGLVLAVLDFVLIGIGVGAAGTSLLALLAASVPAERRPAAATIVWLMMIAGMALTAVAAGKALDPFSFDRLVVVVTVTAAAALLLTLLAVAGVERRVAKPAATPRPQRRTSFRAALSDAWADPEARLFTVFVFVSMLAYSAQDLILEPFAGLVFGMSPGESTSLAGLQHGGVFLGMVATGVLGSLWSRRWSGALRFITIIGCAASALAVGGLALAAGSAGHWPLEANVFLLGVGNGCFAVAAIGSMMALAGAAGPDRSGLRMGLWGAAQGIAFGAGGFSGAAGVDLVALLSGDRVLSFAVVFAAEAFLFLLAAGIAARLGTGPRRTVARAQAPAQMAVQ